MSVLCRTCPKCGAQMWTRQTRGGPRCVCSDRKVCGFVGDPHAFVVTQTEPTTRVKEATT
jgi:ssDNA-binding Zn-finger/Zn-ribbon topoisomerase 1